MPFFKKIIADRMYLYGLLALAVSLIFGFLPILSGREGQGAFFLNFGLAMLYLLGLLVSGRLRKGRQGLPPFFLFLILSLISCYVLNREIEIFHVSSDWMSVVLVICCINYAAVLWYDEMPAWLKGIHVLIMSVSLMLFTYLAIYLVPQYVFSLFCFWVLLLPLHSFVPLLFVIYTVFWLLRISENSRLVRNMIRGGIGLVLLFIIGYVMIWSVQVNAINRYYNEADRDVNKTLPSWVRAAQKIPANLLTERILKTDSRFGTPALRSTGESWLWNMPTIRRSDEFRHDPLITIATAFGWRVQMPVEERTQMLQAVFNDRHQQEERLWSGDELFTEEVNTKIQIWPQYRISYTDMTVKVRCAYNQARWISQEEAIYSFYLPEGSAVTALSLWVNGKESPGILTTRQKADSAYNTIVGREMRDPSVLHWQEGNRVSVRVFPVMAGENRQFRVGVTTPLQFKKGKMEYQSIDIDGPTQITARTPVFVEMMGPAKELDLPSGFDALKNNSFEHNGRIKAGWSISMAPEETASHAFHFKGHTYNVKDYTHQRAFFQPGAVYLDINKSWTKEELDQALLLPGKHKTFVCLDEQLVELTMENKHELFKVLKQQQFSLFPLHRIPNVDTALLITKSNGGSPNLRELNRSAFLESLKILVAPRPRIRLFCIDGALSPYLRTLKEYRVFNYEQGTMDDCNLLLARREFSLDIENENQVVIDHSQMVITRSNDSVVTQAPDHLMRLFAYNHVMQQAGAGLLNGETLSDSLVEEAAEAHVVTPVSSLVVLETQQDYERFKIKPDDGLGNAARSAKGAVPEPHEWALIILAVFLVFTLKFGPVWKRRWN
ncbi:MAG: XrtN system VIT domain-containing protein [Chitinophagaceae bacterium]|nr:XrtN system VIT domain-containing protein [Chitinophagaceae bacterium]